MITPMQGSSEPVEGSIDRTPKLFIAGRQVRPDSGYSTPVYSSTGKQLGFVGQGNRKDIRNAVEAAHAARSWAKSTAHLRAQILYYIAENLSVRREEFAQRITAMTGAANESAKAEVDLSIDRLFMYAAWADKYDGATHGVPIRGVALAMHEPVGIIGMLCSDQAPLLGMVSVLAPAIAMGNTCVVVPSQAYPLAATDLYQVLETSDLPAGVVNIVTAAHSDVVETMAGHMEVDSLWYFGADGHSASIERASVTNLKRTWVNNGRSRDWQDTKQGAGKEFLRQATEVKNIWIPYGE
jgi:aldehyde dehydrogenase (NAD+)